MSFQFFHSSTKSSNKLAIPAMGLELEIKLPQDASGGDLTIIETINAPSFGPPKHRHHETEIFRVLEGYYLYEVDGKRIYCNQGDVICVPGGVEHGFRNLGNHPARQLVLIVPGMDAISFFSGLGKLMEAGRPTLYELNVYGKPWGMEFTGPPISV